MNKNEIKRINLHIKLTKNRLKLLKKTKRKKNPEVWYLRGRLSALNDVVNKALPFLKDQQFNAKKR